MRAFSSKLHSLNVLFSFQGVIFAFDFTNRLQHICFAYYVHLYPAFNYLHLSVVSDNYIVYFLWIKLLSLRISRVANIVRFANVDCDLNCSTDGVKAIDYTA